MDEGAGGERGDPPKLKRSDRYAWAATRSDRDRAGTPVEAGVAESAYRFIADNVLQSIECLQGARRRQGRERAQRFPHILSCGQLAIHTERVSSSCYSSQNATIED